MSTETWGVALLILAAILAGVAIPTLLQLKATLRALELATTRTGPRLDETLATVHGVATKVDALVVPVLPSVLDMEATVRFLNPLAEHPRVASGELPVGLVANRLRPWTQASQQALSQLGAWPCELVAQLRETQAYALLAGLGRCLFDYQSQNVREHQQDWVPLLRWLERARRRR